MYGTYETVDGRPALRFERRLPHPIEKVWRAVTEADELSHWFPAAVTTDELRVGARLGFTFPDDDFPPSDGEVTELDPPRLFAFTWGPERLRFELDSEADGCVLRFTHFLGEGDQASRDAAGWHVCLDLLGRSLAGEPTTGPGTEMTDELRELYDEYARRGMPTGAAMPDAGSSAR